jgi:hypothetical protein
VKVAVSAISLLILFFAIGVAPASAGILYDNGAYGGTTARGISYGLAIANSFVLSSAATVTDVNFVAWTAANGDTMTAVDWLITSAALGGSTLASGTAAPTKTFITTGPGTFSNMDIDYELFSIPDLGLGAGTYWLQLQNASAPSGNYFYWDQNSGPSQAKSSAAGYIPSETFQILGDADTVPEPSTFGLLGTGVLGMAALLRRRIRW